jgi:3-isopropylmalate dehydrogenase
MPKVALFPGDGVGPEVTAEAVKVLDAVGRRHRVAFDFVPLAIGGEALDRFGVPIHSADLDAAGGADAILLGAVGGPQWDTVAPDLRPERGLLQLRKALGLYANLRPVSVLPELVGSSPLKPEIVTGVDFLVVRELTGGIYFGKPSRRWQGARGRAAVDTLRYRENEVARVARLAFHLASARRGKLASVDKANVLQSSRLWREIVTEIAADYPNVALEHVLVDAMAMHLVKSPGRFDVIVTENMFGDILTDEASVLAGSIGLLPSASLGDKIDRGTGGRLGLYEPIHGSAPDIAGQGKANPTGAILSAAMLLRWSLGSSALASAVERAVADVIAAGIRTADVAEPGETAITTAQFGDAVADRIGRD